MRLNKKTAISSSNLSHAEAPVETSPTRSKANIAYSNPNVFQFHTLPELGRGGTAGAGGVLQTYLLPENTLASYSEQEILPPRTFARLALHNMPRRQEACVACPPNQHPQLKSPTCRHGDGFHKGNLFLNSMRFSD